jgi:hypothetical protein
VSAIVSTIGYLSFQQGDRALEIPLARLGVDGGRFSFLRPSHAATSTRFLMASRTCLPNL